jgi:hypothetical protein
VAISAVTLDSIHHLGQDSGVVIRARVGVRARFRDIVRMSIGELIAESTKNLIGDFPTTTSIAHGRA